MQRIVRHRLLRRSAQSARRARGAGRLPLSLIAATVLSVSACGRADPGATTDSEAPANTPAPAPASTTTVPQSSTVPKSSTVHGVEFAELVAGADLVLGPLELDRVRRFAVLGYQDEAGPFGEGVVELLVETAEHGWRVEDRITDDGMPVSISAPTDLDGDGLDEIQVDWIAGVDTDSGRLYRVDDQHLELVVIPFTRAGLNEPMNDYLIVAVEPGFVTTWVEDCEPDCATGSSHVVTWRYDETAGRLVVQTQPEPAPATPLVDPLQIEPGVIEDGIHYGYLVSSAVRSFTFDRADVQADGSWSNTNPKLRTLPYAGSIPWSSGTAIQIVVQDQRVTSVAMVAPPAASDPLRIEPGVIEDGVHYGYLVSSTSTAFVFDRVEILPSGEWQNLNPMTRTLPFPEYIPLPTGTAIEVVVQDQHVVQVSML